MRGRGGRIKIASRTTGHRLFLSSRFFRRRTVNSPVGRESPRGYLRDDNSPDEFEF